MSSTADIKSCLEIKDYPPLAEILQSEKLKAIFKPSFVYLRSLVAHPVCSPDTHSGYILLSTMTQFNEIVQNRISHTIFPAVQRFFGEIRTDIVKELASVLGFPSTNEVELCLHTDWLNPKPAEPWLKSFEYLLNWVREETQFSDLETLAVALFLRLRPSQMKLFFYSDDKFRLKMKDTIVSSSKLDTNTLWRLLTPKQPHHATILLAALLDLWPFWNDMIVEKHIWSGWFPSFVRTVDPSKLPFTGELIPFHTELLYVLRHRFSNFRQYKDLKRRELTDQQRSELDETYHAFYTHTKDYVVHLSLHPFALDDGWRDVILDFLDSSYLCDYRNSLNKPYREDARKAMDEVALSSSSPPFILTSQLVCDLTDDEIINIVDRIVALLESDSCLDDDTILRICAFHKHQLSRIHLPDLFRKAGRSTEQYLHAFECLISLPIDCFDQSPFKYLLTTGWIKEPPFDEWDDIHFERVGIVKRMINQNQLSVANDSKAFITLIVEFIVQRLPQIHHCAARLSQSQFERLLAPSVAFLSHFFIHQPNSTWRESQEQKQQFVDVCKLCDQRVIARSFSRTGFFSRFVTGLFDHHCEGTVSCFQTIIDRYDSPEISIEDILAIQTRISNFEEEGLQDALEFLFVKKYVTSHTTHAVTAQMMKFCGANFNSLRG
ncbi:hypothetical protein BLNAU_5326 [Blattamonas nauphoetae]|uniref:Uncharacterized protein n=1 Tax=Blattamonas nauphoetae TaxID=2049346 RepID=A0ABQ9Y7U4_9EUKA|nr:hypothetical protein BLNAU_5326 [Blattamonas nauphoetae]